MLTLWKKLLKYFVKNLKKSRNPLEKDTKEKMNLGEIYDPYIQNIEDKLRNFSEQRLQYQGKQNSQEK